MNAVMHFQSPFATTLACRPADGIAFSVIPEIPFYIGPIGQVSYLTPGSQELADAVIAVMRDHDLAVMANHGQVTVATSLDQALQNAEFFELACQIIVQNGPDLRPLTPEAVADLRALKTGAARFGV